MSKRVVTLCLSLCLAGFFSGWGLSGLLTAGALKQQQVGWPILLNAAGFLCLPAGIGMLMGSRLGRTLAVLAFAVGYFICAVLLVSPLLQWDLISISINGNRMGFGVYAANSLMLLGVLLLLHWTLYTPPFEEHLS